MFYENEVASILSDKSRNGINTYTQPKSQCRTGLLVLVDDSGHASSQTKVTMTFCRQRDTYLPFCHKAIRSSRVQSFRVRELGISSNPEYALLFLFNLRLVIVHNSTMKLVHTQQSRMSACYWLLTSSF